MSVHQLCVRQGVTHLCSAGEKVLSVFWAVAVHARETRRGCLVNVHERDGLARLGRVGRLLSWLLYSPDCVVEDDDLARSEGRLEQAAGADVSSCGESSWKRLTS
jgi:hypothetical protein